METNKQTTKEFFKTMQIIHAAFVIGLLFLALISSALIYIGVESEIPISDSFIIIAIAVIATIGILASSLVFKSRLKTIIPGSDLSEKLALYRSALIVKFAITEGVSFITIIAFILSGNIIILAIAGLLILTFITYRPTRSKLFMDLELTNSEKNLINNPETVLDMTLNK